MELIRRPNRPFGLDISDVSLKLVQLDRSSGEMTVSAYSDFAVPKEVSSGDKIVSPKLLTQTIKQALGMPKFGKITTPYVVASLPETKCFVRVIQMPAMSEKEALEAVPWEAEAYIPLPISQVYLDWTIFNQEKIRDEAKMTVLITAAPKDYVDDLVGALTEAGLEPIALEAESQATARSIVSKTMTDTALIADIDTVRTSLIIYEKGILRFTSSLPIAGNMLTENISKNLSVSFEEAENLKRQVGAGDISESGIENKKAMRVQKAILPILDSLVEEIKNTIRFYEEHSPGGGKISKLLLVGGSSKLKHLPSFFHDKLTHAVSAEYALRSFPGLKVEMGNPWINILGKGQTPPLSRENSLSYATAIGLAMREME